MKLFTFGILYSLVIAVPVFGKGLEEPLSIEKVVAYLSSHPEIKSVDDFLPHLPKDFRYRRAIGFASRSRHGATPEHPRIILLSKDASFAMAMTGKGDLKNGQDIEMVQFRLNEESPWQFGQYSYAPDITGHEIQGFSGINPKLCTDCHSRQGIVRPIWESYNTWPGFFSEQNNLDFTEATGDSPNLLAKFERFRQSVVSDPGRYQFVFDKEDLKDLRIKTVHSTVERNRGESASSTEVPEDPDGDESSNLRRLSEGFNYHNLQRVMKSLRKEAFYPALKWSLFATTLGCTYKNRIDSFVPDVTRRRQIEKGESWEEVVKGVHESFSRLSKSVMDRLADPERSSYYEGKNRKGPPFAMQQETDIRYLMKMQGKDILDWFLTKESEVGFFSVDSDQEPMLGYMIYEDIVKEAPELATEFVVQEDPTGDSNFRRVYELAGHSRLSQENLRFKTTQALCEELRNRSLRALEQREKTPIRRSSKLENH